MYYDEIHKTRRKTIIDIAKYLSVRKFKTAYTNNSEDFIMRMINMKYHEANLVKFWALKLPYVASAIVVHHENNQLYYLKLVVLI